MERSDTYDHGNVVEYWQWAWDREEVYSCRDPTDPVYVLGMFPYPSGRLHMGHVRNYAITDAIARFERMRGRDVVHPMGWDAFGLPAENAARERGTDPASWTDACIQRMREEMETLGFGFDWDREIRTADPDYYRWNQWLFRQLHEAGLLTYEGAPVNWCPECETVLADAQVVGGSAVDPDGGSGTCWRCSTPVRTRTLDQWFVRITEYADELLAGLDDLDGWADGVRAAQREWIGRREGTRVEFPVREGPADSIEVFTRRLDTIAGATFVAVSPDHDLARTLAERDDAIAEAIADLAPGAGPSAGVETPVVVENPATGDQLPVYVAAYVLGDVGTGAVMGVPAHDEQAHAFAEAHDRPMEVVVERTDESDGSENESVDDSTGDSSADRPMTDPGVVQAPDSVAGTDSATASDRLQADLAAAEAAERYRLRDWLISRQRYWGTP
ncbi:MAG: class I tRNA ligase family protein, partial [Halococcoides sp.]